jgi:hypothetical protein
MRDAKSLWLTLLGCAAIPMADAQLAVEFRASTPAHEPAARSYRAIWQQDGARIVAALEAHTCLRFAEATVAALIDDAGSHSGGPEHPMSLRATYPLDLKRATLVHELGHRHLWQLTQRLDEIDGHRTLYLILDRVWAAVWGEQFAAERIGGESAWQSGYDYAAAWSWARALTLSERAALWQRLLALNGFAGCGVGAAPTQAGTRGEPSLTSGGTGRSGSPTDAAGFDEARPRQSAAQGRVAE